MVSFEMGPPFHMLDINKRYVCHNSQYSGHMRINTNANATSSQISLIRLNPELNLDIYNLAIYDKNGTVFYEVANHFFSFWTILTKTGQGSECDGCNGGINADEEGVPVQAVALVPFLLQRYSR